MLHPALALTVVREPPAVSTYMMQLTLLRVHVQYTIDTASGLALSLPTLFALLRATSDYLTKPVQAVRQQLTHIETIALSLLHVAQGLGAWGTFQRRCPAGASPGQQSPFCHISDLSLHLLL